MAKLPLEGVRVIDMTIVAAGPYATIMLGDLGAEVIRVESLQRADPNTRGEFQLPSPFPPAQRAQFFQGEPGEQPWERRAGFHYSGRNKFSMTVDLTRPSGNDVFKRLVQVSDVLLQNNAPGTMDRLGLGWPVLSEVNPRLVMACLSGFGESGPYHTYKGFGPQFESMVGTNSLRGYTDMDLGSAPYTLHSDAGGGASAVFGIMAALLYRERMGKGQFIDMAQAENVAQHVTPAFLDFTMNGRVPATTGNRHRTFAPQGCYRCQGDDNWLVLTITSDAQWGRLCAVIGRAELADDPRFADGLSRYQHQDEADAVIAAWTATKTHYDAMRLLQDSGVPAGAVLSPEDASQDPHLEARGFFRTITHPLLGSYRMPGPFFKLSKTPLEVRHPAPMLGQHNAYVYKQLLGYSDEEYDALISEQHIGTLYTALQEKEAVRA